MLASWYGLLAYRLIDKFQLKKINNIDCFDFDPKAKSVAKKVTPLPIDLPDELVNSLRRLGDLVQKQLKDVLDAYLNNSKDKAIEIWRKDEQVDDLTNLAMNEVANYLQKDKKNLEMATHLLFVTKNIERAGDHITNIAESLYYLIEGEYLEGARPKGKPIDS